MLAETKEFLKQMGNKKTLLNLVLGGNGTKEEPYIIYKDDPDPVGTEYIVLNFLYSDYKIVSQSLIENSIDLLKIDVGGEIIDVYFSF